MQFVSNCKSTIKHEDFLIYEPKEVAVMWRTPKACSCKAFVSFLLPSSMLLRYPQNRSFFSSRLPFASLFTKLSKLPMIPSEWIHNNIPEFFCWRWWYARVQLPKSENETFYVFLLFSVFSSWHENLNAIYAHTNKRRERRRIIPKRKLRNCIYSRKTHFSLCFMLLRPL